jgi:hypothetical protein
MMRMRIFLRVSIISTDEAMKIGGEEGVADMLGG